MERSIMPLDEISKETKHDIESLIEKAKTWLKLKDEITKVVLSLTSQSDWLNVNDQPYPTIKAIGKLRKAFGITWKIDEVKRIDYPNGHFEYVFRGRFAFGPITEDNPTVIEVSGSRYSAQDFFATRYETDPETGERKKVQLDPQEIDPGNVRKAAETNFIGRGIRRLLALDGLSWEDLEKYGITKDGARKVTFREKKKEEKQQKEKKEEKSNENKTTPLFQEVKEQ